MHIWLDADSCPAPIRKITLQKASDKNIPITFAANRNVDPAFDYPLFTMQVCPKNEGAADDYLVENADKGDLAVTRDIPLAKRLVSKGVRVINDRGLEFSELNIRKMLEERELHLQMVELGIAPKGNWKSFGKEDIKKFRKCLDSILP